jgi:hypothetical protein
MVGNPRSQDLVNVFGKPDLQFGVTRDDRFPRSHILYRADGEAQWFAAVAHQHPAAGGVHGDEVGYAIETSRKFLVNAIS